MMHKLHSVMGEWDARCELGGAIELDEGCFTRENGLKGGEPLKIRNFIKEIYGKLVADKGYISKELFKELFINGMQLVTKVRNNMKNSLMSVADKVLLRKRALIESANDELKNIAQIEHSRHRSFNNFIVNALAAIAAYCFFPKKPSINIQHYNDNQLVLL